MSEDLSGVNAHHAYDCAFCGEENEVFVDGSGARTQRFTEDCQVCCRPNLLTMRNGKEPRAKHDWPQVTLPDALASG